MNGADGASSTATGWRRIGVAAALTIVAGVCFAATLGTALEPTEEGIILYPSWRVARGDVPYRDFVHLYTPGVFWVFGSLFASIGSPDLFAARVVLSLWKTVLSLLVLLIAARAAGRVAALLAWLVFVVVWSAPVWVFQTPYASHFGVGLTLIGANVLLSRRAPRPLRLLAGGMVFGAAALFKQTLGVLNVFAVLLAWRSVQQRSAPAQRAIASRWATAAVVGLCGAAAAFYLSYIWPHHDSLGAWVLVAPALGAAAAVAWRDVRGGASATGAALAELAWLAAGTALAPLACVGWYAAHGDLSALVASTLLDLPRRVIWFDALPVPSVGTLVLLVGLGALFGALQAGLCGERRRAAAWAAALLLAVTAAAVAPASVLAARTVFELFRWLPLVLLVICAGAGLTTAVPAADEQARARVVCWFLAAAALLQLYPAADLAHVGMILPIVLPLLAVAVDRFLATVLRSTRSGGWLPRAAAVTALVLVVGAGLTPFARMAWHRAGLPRTAIVEHVAAVNGPGSPPANIAVLVRRLRGEPGPMLVLSGEQLLYVLTERDSVTPREEHVVYLAAAGLLAPGDAAAWLDEQRLIERLVASGAPIVEKPRSPEQARIRAAFPALAAYLDRAYRPVEVIGPYRILRPVAVAAEPQT